MSKYEPVYTDTARVISGYHKGYTAKLREKCGDDLYHLEGLYNVEFKSAQLEKVEDQPKPKPWYVRMFQRND